MGQQAIDRIVELLETDPDFFVPLKKLWVLLREEGHLPEDVDLADLARQIEKDNRFSLAAGVDGLDGRGPSDEETDQKKQEMEMLGFYSGPWVKLTERTMTVQDVFDAMTRNLTRINTALQKAWDVRPEGDQDTEDQLLEILAAGQRLEREIQNVIDNHQED